MPTNPPDAHTQAGMMEQSPAKVTLRERKGRMNRDKAPDETKTELWAPECGNGVKVKNAYGTKNNFISWAKQGPCPVEDWHTLWLLFITTTESLC